MNIHLQRLLQAFISLVLVPVCISMPQTAAADQSGAKTEPTVLEEIIVTAQKRGPEKLQNVPVSIKAFNSDMLEKMGVTQFTDFAYQVPGLTFNDFGPGEKTYIIRGISSAGQQQVTPYYDEVTLPGTQGEGGNSGGNTPGLVLYDMNRIEVLRGPQGTAYGANAETGVVRFITNKPVLDKYQADMKGDVSSTRHAGDINFGGYVMGNLPIVNDVLGLRVAALHREDAGYINNVRLNQNNINFVDTTAVRAILRYRPHPSLTFDAMAWYQDLNSGGSPEYDPTDPLEQIPPVAAFPTGRFRVGDYSRTNLSDRQQIYSLTMHWDLGPAAVTAAGSYYDRDFKPNFDGTWTGLGFGITPNGTIDDPDNPNPALGRPDLFPEVSYEPQSVKQDMFEARVHSTWDRRWNYLAGFFWRRRITPFSQFVRVVNSQGVPFDPGLAFYPPPAVGAGISGCQPCVFARFDKKEIKDLALFGELTFDLTDQITLLAGLRWFKNNQSEYGQTLFPFALFPPGPTTPTSATSSDDKLIKKFQVTYNPAGNIMLYLTAAQGFRLGGTNNQGIVQLPSQYKSEQLWNYEAGWKTSWFDRRLIIDGSVFKIVWKDFQVNANIKNTPTGFITNLGAVGVTGLELELNAAPTDHWQLGFGLNWLAQKELTEDAVATVNIGGKPVELVAPGKKGDQLPGIPEITLNGDLQYNYTLKALPAWRDWLLAYWSYVGPSYTDPMPSGAGDIYNRLHRGYGIVNLRAGFDDPAWKTDVALYVDNVADVQGDVALFANPGFPTRKVTNRPRTIGIQFDKKF